MPTEQGVQNAHEADGSSKVGLVLQSAGDEGHDPDSEDIGLLRVTQKYGGMVGEYRLDQFQAECLRQAGKAKVLRALVLGEQAEIVKDLAQC